METSHYFVRNAFLRFRQQNLKIYFFSGFWKLLTLFETKNLHECNQICRFNMQLFPVYLTFFRLEMSFSSIISTIRQVTFKNFASYVVTHIFSSFLFFVKVGLQQLVDLKSYKSPAFTFASDTAGKKSCRNLNATG